MPRKTAARVPDEVVTPEELAKECKVQRGTIYAWRSRGQGPQGFLLEGSLRFRRSEVDRWLAECGDTATAS
jgi:predicted DNA-binding transcriptional regulator AlpA